MWIPTVTAVAEGEVEFFPVVKEACGYDDYANLLVKHDPKNQCVDWYRWALKVIRHLHPDVIVVGAYGFREWAKGLSDVLPRLKALTPRVVLIADAPGIEEIPGFCLSQSGATLASCLWPESNLRIADLKIARRLARSLRIGFIDPEPWFCDQHRCPSLINGIIPYYDSGHLTATYARYLAPELGQQLALSGWSP